jgi:hypothetical protein
MIPLYLIRTQILQTRNASDGEKRGMTVLDIAHGFLQSLKTPIILGAFAGLIWSPSLFAIICS